MIDKNVPCYGCERRRVSEGYNCHSDCPDYKAFAQARADRSRMICKKRAEEAMITDARIKAIQRTAKDKKKTYAWRDK